MPRIKETDEVRKQRAAMLLATITVDEWAQAERELLASYATQAEQIRDNGHWTWHNTNRGTVWFHEDAPDIRTPNDVEGLVIECPPNDYVIPETVRDVLYTRMLGLASRLITPTYDRVKFKASNYVCDEAWYSAAAELELRIVDRQFIEADQPHWQHEGF